MNPHPGIDCLLAAARVGERGRVIGVDMAPEMPLTQAPPALISELALTLVLALAFTLTRSQRC